MQFLLFFYLKTEFNKVTRSMTSATPLQTDRYRNDTVQMRALWTVLDIDTLPATPTAINVGTTLRSDNVKGKGMDTCYNAAYMSQTRDQQRFTISEVAADWHEPMVPQRIIWPSIARAN